MTVGYIVTQGIRGALALGGYDDTPKKGVLVCGATAYFFKSRQGARNAIARTQNYSILHNLHWETYGSFTICRVVNTREC